MSANLTIPEGLTIQLDYKNCLMPHQEPDGSISRPFVLPKENAKFFEFHNRVNKVKTKQPITPISLYSKGIKLKEGILKLNKFTEDGKFDCDFIFDAGAFNSIIKGKYLNDISYKITAVESETLADWYTYMNSCTEGIYPEKEVAFFPIYTPNIEIKIPIDDEERLSTFKEIYPACLIANYWDRVNSSFGFPDVDINGDAAIFKGGERAIIPFWYVGKVVEEIFKYAGYTINQNILKTEAVLRRMVVYNLNTDREQPDIFGNDYFHISFKYDLPHILISDFIKELRQRGIIFNIKEDRREVDILLLKDILTQNYDKDLSEKTGRKKTIEFNNVGKIKFTGGGDGYLDKTFDRLINSSDYDIDNNTEIEKVVIRDEKVVRTWKKSDYNDSSNSMINSQYETNNYYEASNAFGSEEIEIQTDSEIIEDIEITDVVNVSGNLKPTVYKKLMPNAGDDVRKWENATIKDFKFGFLLNWGIVEMPIGDTQWGLTLPDDYIITFNSPHGSSNNYVIKNADLYPLKYNGLEITRVYVKGEAVSPWKYRIYIELNNPTATAINYYFTWNVGTDVGYDVGGTLFYIYASGLFNDSLSANSSITLFTDLIDGRTDDKGIVKDYYLILKDAAGHMQGEVFYIQGGKTLSGANWHLNKSREGYRFYSGQKLHIGNQVINFIKQDLGVIGTIDNNVNSQDLPYCKAPIPGMPDVSINLDKWVPYFLQEYVDMMLSANTIRIERLMQLTVEDLKEMTLMKKYINNPDDAETGEYLIEEMSVAVKSDGVSAARCRLLKVN